MVKKEQLLKDLKDYVNFEEDIIKNLADFYFIEW